MLFTKRTSRKPTTKVVCFRLSFCNKLVTRLLQYQVRFLDSSSNRFSKTNYNPVTVYLNDIIHCFVKNCIFFVPSVNTFGTRFFKTGTKKASLFRGA